MQRNQVPREMDYFCYLRSFFILSTNSFTRKSSAIPYEVYVIEEAENCIICLSDKPFREAITDTCEHVASLIFLLDSK